MNIFLLGATGLTGQEVLKRLLRDKHHVKVLVRDSYRVRNYLKSNHLDVIVGTIMDSDKLSSQFAESDVVISALGTGTDNSYTDVYSNGGRNILKQCGLMG